MTVDVFSVPIFFIVFRESLETWIIVSVLLAFLKQTLDGPNHDLPTYKKLVKQVWLGTGLGLLICLIIGGGLIGAFYGLGKDRWANAEYYWEASFAIVACIIISVVGVALLRVSKMQEKWRVKIAASMEAKIKTDSRENRRVVFRRWCEKYAMFILPFITILREGLEAVVFVAGVAFSAPATAIPLPVVIGLIAGAVVGYLIYKGGASSKLQIFLVISTCVLYLVAAGLLSRAVWFIEAQKWNEETGADSAETGSGPGSYDIEKSVWHVNSANPELNGGGGWGIFNSILGWQNSATYGTVISYNLYWICIMTAFLLMRYKENTGHLPFMKAKTSPAIDEVAGSGKDSETSSAIKTLPEKSAQTTNVAGGAREISE